MKIGLCGASGRIGLPLFKFLKAKGNKVVGTYCNNKIPDLVRFDLREDPLDFFDKCDVVILAAAYTNTPFCEQNKIEAFWMNVYRTIALLTHLSDKKIPTMFISSVAAVENLDTVYGDYKRRVEKCIKKEQLKIEYIRPGYTNKDNVQALCKEIYADIKSWRRKKTKK